MEKPVKKNGEKNRSGRSQLAGVRLRIAIDCTGALEAVMKTFDWPRLIGISSPKAVRAWMDDGVPHRRIVDVAEFFGLKPIDFVDSEISNDDFVLRLARQRSLETSPNTTGPSDRNAPEALICLENPKAVFNIRMEPKRCDAVPGETERDLVLAHADAPYFFRAGERFVVSARSSSDATLYCFNMGTSGRLSLHRIDIEKRGNRARADIAIEFPDRRMAWYLTGPAGVERLKIIASKVPIGLLEMITKTAATTGRALIDEPGATAIIRAIRELDPKIWATGGCAIVLSA